MKDTKATVRYAGDDFFVAIPPSGHALTLDMNGERSDGASPLELLLVDRIVACHFAERTLAQHQVGIEEPSG